MISCKLASKLSSKSLEIKLTKKEQLHLKTHLTICNACLNFDKQINLLRKILLNFSDAIFDLPHNESKSLSIKSTKKLKKSIIDTLTLFK